MENRTVGVSPKTTAAAVAALIAPCLANVLGVDEAGLLGLITTVIVAFVAYFAPAGEVEQR